MNTIADQLADLDELLRAIPEKHRGILFERVLEGFHPQENTRRLERSFATLWAEKNREGDSVLSTILLADTFDPRKEFIPRNNREWQVAYLIAATLIQWLPTTVGCAFLREAFRGGGGDFNYKLPEIKD